MRMKVWVMVVILLVAGMTVSAKVVDVTAFGALGDGEADNTRAFQSAMDSLAEIGGIVTIPSGRYLFKGNLVVPKAVTLEGSFRNSPPRSIAGSVLLVTAGAGDPEGEPFLQLQENSGLCGLVIHYPKQVTKSEPIPFAWTIRGHGDNIAIKNCLLTNSYKAVDFGTFPCGRHHIDGLYGRPLLKGIFIDKCYDVGRVENVHFWPFWESEAPALRSFQEQQGEAFVIGRTDWQYMVNCFCLWYGKGFRFIRSDEPGTGSGNVVLTNCGSDLGPVALLVEEVQNHAGIGLVNCQLMGSVILENTNHGPVKFTNCGFWGIHNTNILVINRSSGRSSFVNCHFSWWDRQNKGYPALVSQNGDLTLMGCEFGEPGKVDIVLSSAIRTALVTGNTLRTPIRTGIINKAGRKARVKNNVFSFKAEGRAPLPPRKEIKKRIKELNGK